MKPTLIRFAAPLLALFALAGPAAARVTAAPVVIARVDQISLRPDGSTRIALHVEKTLRGSRRAALTLALPSMAHAPCLGDRIAIAFVVDAQGIARPFDAASLVGAPTHKQLLALLVHAATPHLLAAK